jgi:hypothetical protein
MHLLLTDETNLATERGAKFFVYGGLVCPMDRLLAIHEGIETIRKGAGYRVGDVLKFHTSSRPAHVSIEQATGAKNAVVELCIANGCKFIAYVVLHAIAKNTAQPELISNGANHVIGKFNIFLHEKADYGLVAVDRLPGAAEYSYLSDKFTKGLTFSDAAPVALDRILLFSSTCTNASHLSSAMDIVLGSFRYCINDPSNVGAAKAMMWNVTKLLWCVREGTTIYAFERGLIMRPKEIKVKAYQTEYDALIRHINALIAEQEQASAP